MSGLTMGGALRLGFGPGSEQVVVGSLLTCRPLATAIPSARQINSAHLRSQIKRARPHRPRDIFHADALMSFLGHHFY